MIISNLFHPYVHPIVFLLLFTTFGLLLLFLHLLGNKELRKRAVHEAKEIVSDIVKQCRWRFRQRFVNDTTCEFVFLILQVVKQMPVSDKKVVLPELKNPAKKHFPRTVEYLEGHLVELRREQVDAEKRLTETQENMARLAPFLHLSQDRFLPPYLIWVRVKVGMKSREAEVSYIPYLPSQHKFLVRALVEELAKEGFLSSKKETSIQPDPEEFGTQE